MILVDLSGIAYASVYAHIDRNAVNQKIEPALLRHIMLNIIRANRKKFVKDYGEMVIACDSGSWRKTIFPYYKAARKEKRRVSPIDWESVFEALRRFEHELSVYFPYPVIKVEGAEADDVIATLARHKAETDKANLILSRDKDFVQLHALEHAVVRQFSPVDKKWIESADPIRDLKEKIFRGEPKGGDGIPNVMSKDDAFMGGNRQSSLSEKKLDVLMSIHPDAITAMYGEEVYRNYKRNRQLIDLTLTPETLQKEIIDSFEKQCDKDRSKLFTYFTTYNLPQLSQSIGDF